GNLATRRPNRPTTYGKHPDLLLHLAVEHRVREKSSTPLQALVRPPQLADLTLQLRDPLAVITRGPRHGHRRRSRPASPTSATPPDAHRADPRSASSHPPSTPDPAAPPTPSASPAPEAPDCTSAALP